MDLELSKLELIDMLLHTRKETVLQKIRAIFEEEEKEGFDRDEAFYAMLDARRERHERGESKSYTWEEIEQDIKAKKNV